MHQDYKQKVKHKNRTERGSLNDRKYHSTEKYTIMYAWLTKPLSRVLKETKYKALLMAWQHLRTGLLKKKKNIYKSSLEPVFEADIRIKPATFN